MDIRSIPHLPVEINNNNNSLDKIIHDVDFAPFLMWQNDKIFKDLNFITNEPQIKFIDKSTNKESNDYVKYIKQNYYSDNNKKSIEDQIILNIFNFFNKKVKIKKIKDIDLDNTMMYMEKNYCQYLPLNFKEQILNLNKRVIQYLTRIFIPEIEAHLNFINTEKNINKRPLLDLPVAEYTVRKFSLPAPPFLR